MAVVFQLLSHVQLFVTPWTTARQASLYSLSPWLCSNSCPWSQWCHPTISSFVDSSSCPQSFPASGSFPMNWLLASWPKCWSFSFSTSPSSEYSGLISFRIDWFNLLAVQGTLKSPLQHNLKASLFSAQPSLWSNSHIQTWLLKNHSFDYTDLCWQSDVSAF